jgi:imidazoleglycerol-phosphate dehydratase
MDEALVRAAVDLSGRPYCDISFPASGPQSLSENTVVDFWQGFASHAALTLHIDVLKGRSSHHIIEAMFKAAAKALRQACEIDLRAAGAIPSTKGVLVC